MGHLKISLKDFKMDLVFILNVVFTRHDKQDAGCKIQDTSYLKKIGEILLDSFRIVKRFHIAVG